MKHLCFFIIVFLLSFSLFSEPYSTEPVNSEQFNPNGFSPEEFSQELKLAKEGVATHQYNVAYAYHHGEGG